MRTLSVFDIHSRNQQLLRRHCDAGKVRDSGIGSVVPSAAQPLLYAAIISLPHDRAEGFFSAERKWQQCVPLRGLCSKLK